VNEIAAGIWHWTRRHPQWHPGPFGAEVASYALRDIAGLVIVDPLFVSQADEGIDELAELAEGSVRILITIPYHVRSSELVRNRLREAGYDVEIYGHPRCASRFEDTAGFHPVEGGEELAGGVRVHSFGSPRRMELPFELTSHRALTFGDLVVETGGGALRVWEQWEAKAGWYEGRFLPTLRPLADLDLERVLVTHGAPVLAGGARALAKAFDQPPWRP
jgi:glyoxylase-like metal-dependent hydrolase (beta-lactamase superfamily II)